MEKCLRSFALFVKLTRVILRVVFISLVMGFGSVGCASKASGSRNPSAAERVFNRDTNRASSFSDRQFNGGGSVRVKEFGGTKSAYTKSFRSDAYGTREFFGGKKKAHDKTFATSSAALGMKGRTVKNIDTPFGVRTADTREFSGARKSSSYDSEFSTHASTFRGKKQKQLDLEDVSREDLSLDDIREILNKR